MIEIPIGMEPTDWDEAYEAARAVMGRRPISTVDSKYWTRTEETAFGFWGERALRRHLGLPIAPFVVFASGGDGGAPDVGPYEVKCIPWKEQAHRHTKFGFGGRVLVFDHAKAPIIVAITGFWDSRYDEALFSGWIYTHDALTYPRTGQPTRKGLPAHGVPLTQLLPAADFPARPLPTPEARLPTACCGEPHCNHSCPTCPGVHDSCEFGGGSLYCVKPTCGNPHHRREEREWA